MFDRYLEPGTTLYWIAKQLTDLGLPTPTGKLRWNVSTVRGILTNPAYTGVAYAHRSYPVPAKRRKSALQPIGRGESRALRPEEEWIAVAVPGVVTQEVFDRVQVKLSDNQQMSSRNNKVHDYLLRGLVSCGHCRLSAMGRTIGGEYAYYICRGRTDALRAAQGQRCTARYAPAAQLDELVWQDLYQVLTQPEIMAHALERAHGGHWLPQELRARIDALHKAEKQLERQYERLLEAYLADVVTLPELERKRRELTQKQQALTTQRTQLEATVDQRLELSQTAASIQAFCAQIRPTLDQANFARRRQLVELLIDRVIVTDEQVEIRYVVPTRPECSHVPFSHLRSDYRSRGQGRKARFRDAPPESAFSCWPGYPGGVCSAGSQPGAMGCRVAGRAAVPASKTVGSGSRLGKADGPRHGEHIGRRLLAVRRLCVVKVRRSEPLSRGRTLDRTGLGASTALATVPK